MKFNYLREIDEIFSKLEKHIENVVNNVDHYKKEDDEVDSSQMMNDINWELSDIRADIMKFVHEDVVDDVVYQMDNLNSQSDEELIEIIRENKEAYNYIIDPSDEVVAMYKFLYEL